MTTLEPFDDDTPVPVPVDPPHPPPTFIDASVVATHTLTKRPIVPVWMRSRSEFRALITWLARYGAHGCGYHLPRLPFYFRPTGRPLTRRRVDGAPHVVVLGVAPRAARRPDGRDPAERHRRIPAPLPVAEGAD
jgi:hypothetical protein